MGSGIARLRSILFRLWWIETSRANQVDKRDRRLQWAVEAAAIVVLLLSGLTFGGNTYRNNLASAEFYQPHFGPALNLACNGTFNETSLTPAVKDFLDRKSGSLGGCEDVQDFPRRKLDPLQASTAYLQFMTAGAWKMLGVSWRNLYVIAALFTAGLVLSCYLLLRVFCESRLLAAIATILFMWSYPVVQQIPHLRDFSKAPFLVAALACLAAATLRPHRPPAIFLLAAASGSMVAIGLGFRPDLNVLLPIALAAPILFVGRGRWPSAIGYAIVAWIGFAAGYIVLRLPLLLVPAAVSATAVSSEPGTLLPHVFILGFAEQFLHKELEMATASYSVLRPYIDDAVYGASSLFAGTPAADSMPWGSVRYGEVSGGLLRAIFLLTPQDALFRVFYSFNAIAHLPPLSRIGGTPLLLLTPLLLFTRLREYLFILLSLAVLVSVLSLQFDLRHAFYIPVLGWATLLLAASAALSVIRNVSRSGFTLPPGAVPLGVGFAATCLVMFASMAALTRFLGAAQGDALTRLARTYSQLEWRSVAYRDTRDGLEPLLTNPPPTNTPEGPGNSYILKQGSSGASAAPEHGVLSRLTVKLQAFDLGDRFPFKLTWAASQEDVSIQGEAFQFSTKKMGYAIESGPIAGADLTSFLAGKGLPPKASLRIKGETFGGAPSVEVLNKTKTSSAFSDPLPRGKWDYVRSFDITPDLSSFTIAFKNLGGRSAFRVDSVELLAPLTGGCWFPGATLSAKYRYVSDTVNLGGFRLPDRGGIATYYFPQAFTRMLSFSGLDLGGISADCVLDWSVAKSFPAGTVPAELLLVDGKLDTLQRGDWETVWRRFD